MRSHFFQIYVCTSDGGFACATSVLDVVRRGCGDGCRFCLTRVCYHRSHLSESSANTPNTCVTPKWNEAKLPDIYLKRERVACLQAMIFTHFALRHAIAPASLAVIFVLTCPNFWLKATPCSSTRVARCHVLRRVFTRYTGRGNVS